MISKKALIVVENNFIPVDTRVWSEATSLRDAGWRITVICPMPTGVYGKNFSPVTFGKPVDLDGICVYYFPINATRDNTLGYLMEYLSAFISITRLSWIIWRKDGFDILQFCNPPDIFFPLTWFYRLLGVKTIFDHHDLFPEFIQHRYHGLAGKLLYGFARVMEFLTFQSAHRTISVNESYRIIAHSRGRVPADRLVVVRNGPKVGEFKAVEPVLSLKRGSKYLAAYVGVMGHEDGILEMMKAIRYVIHDLDRKDIQFAIIGDGSLRPLALDLVSAWGLGDKVDMPGMVQDRLLIRQYLSTADVCLSPEPLSPLNAKSTFIKVGEYMAIGKPIVAYNLDETRWTAQDAAVYVSPGDTPAFAQAIIALVDDPDRRRRMGECGRERISAQLCWEHQQKKLIQTYEALIPMDH